jgi:hypothetical protein
MRRVQITHPAPDGNGTSIIVDGVEMKHATSAVAIESQGGLPPTVTLTVGWCDDVQFDAHAHVEIDPASAAMLAALGWAAPAVAS